MWGSCEKLAIIRISTGILTFYSSRKLEVWLSLGGFHERGHDWESDRRIYNSHIIINDKGNLSLHSFHCYYTHRHTFQDPQSMFSTWWFLSVRSDTLSHWHTVIIFTGDIISVYRKSHLFDVELPEKGVSLKESAFTIPGPSLTSPVQTPIGKVSSYEIIIFIY